MELSKRQQQSAAAAITILSVVVILAALGGLFWLIGMFFRAFHHVFLPLAVAAVLALVFQPYFQWLRTKLKLPPPVAIVALLLSVLLPVAAFGTFFGVVIAGQIGELIDKFPAWWDKTMDYLKVHWPQVVTFLEEHPVGQKIRSAMEGQGDALMEGLQFFGGKAWSAGASMMRAVAAIASWVVMPVYFIFFLMMKRMELTKLGDYLPFLKEETRRDVVFLVKEFVNIIVAFFRGQLIVAFLQGLLFAIGFSIAGLKFGLVLGLLLGFLNIIPYLGSIIGLGVCLPLAYFQQDGGWWTLIWVVVVFTIVQLIEGYLLTPKIMGDRTGLHPMAIIVAVFFWGAALGGILGMILAIPLTAFLVVFWRLAREKYIQEWV